MTNESRWLDELPLESAERELLVAGKSARPRNADVDASWRAFCIASSGTTSAAASGGAAHVASVKATSGLATKAGASALLSAATMKSFVVGMALGVGVSGTGAIVQRLSHADASRASAVGRPLAPVARPVSTLHKTAPLVAEPPTAMPAPSTAERADVTERVARDVPRPASGAVATPPDTLAPGGVASAAFVAPTGVSLSTEARELAQVKRLLDAGATADALRRLEATFSAGAPAALSEERDALYVQALTRAQRHAEARVRAREFVSRYPRSPYVEIIRHVAEE